MKVLFTFIYLFFVVFLAGDLFTDLEPQVIDARAEALGRTSILSSQGSNSVFNNPSLLSNIDNSEACLSSRIIFGNIAVEQTHEEYDNDYDMKGTFHLKFNGISFAMPDKFIQQKDFNVGYGIGYCSYFDWGSNNKVESEMGGTKIKNHGGLSTVVFGVGCNYLEKYYAGISLSVPLLSTFSTEYIESGHTDHEIEGDVSATFTTYSLGYVVNDKMTIGLRIRSNFSLGSEIDYVDANYYQTIKVPTELGFAIKITPSDTYKIFAEYTGRRFSEYELFGNSDGYILPLQNLYGKSKDGFSINTGIEAYKANKICRGGLFIQSIQKADTYSNSEYNVTPKLEVGFTGGLNMELSKCTSIDIFGSFSTFSYSEKEYDWDEWVNTTWTYSRFKLGSSLTYNF